MTTLRALWDPGRRYRTFVHRPLGMVTVVSSMLSDEAEGRTVGPLLIVLDSEGYVCDLELRLPEESALISTSKMQPPPPDEADRVHAPLKVVLDTTASISVALDSDWMIIGLSEADTGRWVQLGEQPLYLFVSGEQLVALAVREPTDDPDGKSEGLWLDQIEGGRKDQEQAGRVAR